MKVDMTSHSMYDFITTLVEFVVPRLREFNGILVPYHRRDMYDAPNAISGVVWLGCPSHVCRCSPDRGQRGPVSGDVRMHVLFVTSATGVEAQEQARALVSGL
jgi:large subunit ribosomal protein L5